MKYYIYLLIVLTTISSYGQTSPPDDWTVNAAYFESFITFTGFVNLKGDRLTGEKDMIGAFIDGEYRGGINIRQNNINGAYYVNFGVHANSNDNFGQSDSGKKIQFKIYHSQSGGVTDIEKTLLITSSSFSSHYGNNFQPYSFSQPALSTGTDLLKVSFDGLEFSEIYNIPNDINKNVRIRLNSKENVENLNTLFVLDTGATIHLTDTPRTQVVSGGNGLNFTNSIEFIVLSQDKSRIERWEVIVNTQSETPDFLKKDAVCYKGGVIEVVLSYHPGTFVTLEYQNNRGETVIKSEKFGKEDDQGYDTVTFENLEEGEYIVSHIASGTEPRTITIIERNQNNINR
jgi:hypothetical protein